MGLQIEARNEGDAATREAAMKGTACRREDRRGFPCGRTQGAMVAEDADAYSVSLLAVVHIHTRWHVVIQSDAFARTRSGRVRSGITSGRE